eukprot:scaffold29816_cov49-Attheya_sp.AAC.1
MCKGPETVSSKNEALSEPISKTKLVTKEELRSHNGPRNAWCAVHGKVVDIAEFSKRHPGGDLILLAAGIDATVLFETYHPRGVPPALLNKLQVGVMKEGELDTSFYSWDSEFYTTMKKRVVARLEERDLTRRGSYEIWIKALFILVGFWGSLGKMYTSETFGEAAVWAIVMGAFASFVGTCIQHDGNHGAFSNSRALNKMSGWTLDMIGASAFTWEFQHMLGHHPYTNVMDMDEDARKQNGVDCPMNEKDQESDPDVFSSFPAMRMHPSHKPEWFHRYQHIYAPFLFAFMTLAKVFQQDVEIAVSKRLFHIDATCRYGSIWNVARFWAMKVLSAIYMIGLPCYFHGVLRGTALFFVGHFTCGEMLATMFIVNHVIEGIAFATKGGQGTDKDKEQRPTTVTGTTPMTATLKTKKNKDTPTVPLNDWAAVQCQTSVNWSPGSWFWNHVSGGLSHQIEHHLFPSICHTNYVYLQDVVEQTCHEYGVPYQAEPNLWIAYGKMLSHLKFLGSEKQE